MHMLPGICSLYWETLGGKPVCACPGDAYHPNVSIITLFQMSWNKMPDLEFEDYSAK